MEPRIQLKDKESRIQYLAFRITQHGIQKQKTILDYLRWANSSVVMPLLFRNIARLHSRRASSLPGCNLTGKKKVFTDEKGSTPTDTNHPREKRRSQGIHKQERATPILGLCHGVFTHRFIFRHILGHFLPPCLRAHSKYTISKRKTKRS